MGCVRRQPVALNVSVFNAAEADKASLMLSTIVSNQPEADDRRR
jgi:hypothetical protein